MLILSVDEAEDSIQVVSEGGIISGLVSFFVKVVDVSL